MNPLSILLLVVFGVSVLVTYLGVRRGLIKTIVAIVVGSIANVILFFLYSLSSGNVLTQAVLVGLVLGLLFNLVTVAAATFFRQNTELQQTNPSDPQ